MAVTIDDLPWNHQGEGAGFLDAARRGTDAMLAALRSPSRAGGLGRQREQAGGAGAEERAARVALLEQWVAAGHVLGNHGYSHRDANALTAEAYLADVAKGDAVTRELMRRRQPYTLFFRHPYTHTGDTLGKRDAITRGLAARGYTVMPHTIENSRLALRRGLRRRPTLPAARSSWRPTWRTRPPRRRSPRPRPASCSAATTCRRRCSSTRIAINADALDALLKMLDGRGYRFITLEEAMRDKAYATPDVYVGRTGPSWLFRWSRTIAPASNFRADPEVPAWVMALYQAAQRR